MNRLQRLLLIASVLVVSIAFDQATKNIAASSLRFSGVRSFLGDTFRLQYSENRGAFLSLGANLPDGVRYALLTVGVAVMLAALLGFALFAQGLKPWQVAGYALIVGGGGSNWADRAFRSGRVVDFMNLGIGPVRSGIFNVADLAVIAGLLCILFADRGRHARARDGVAPAA